MGFGAKLIDEIINHPQLNTVEQITLCCLPEMIPFYERWGFISAGDKIQLMGKSQKQPLQ